MNLTRSIIHEIIKQPQTNVATSFLSHVLLPINQNSIGLAQNLNAAFSKDDNSYGNFQIENNTFLNDYIEHQQSLSDPSFIAFSQNVITRLSTTIAKVFLAKGGFFVFCEYSLNNLDFIAVYLVRDIEGVLFNKDSINHTFHINQVRYLDTNRLAMGARLSVQKWIDGDNNHITLTKNNQLDISEYFIDWIGVTRPESNADFTNTLFQIITSIPRPINPATGSQYELNEFREVAYNIIKASPDKVINLRDLGKTLFQDEQSIIFFAESNGYELDHKFKYDGRALNKFKRIAANRDGIRLSFARGDINSKVSLSDEEADLITIRSKSLAEEVRQQMSMQ